MSATPPSDESAAPSSSTAGSKCPGCGEENVRLKTIDGMLICDKCASKKFSSKVRKSIQDAFDKQQDLQRKEAYARRLQITKQAYAALSRGKAQEAMQLYERYLEILNTRFKKTTENLHPHLFDAKKDEQELLLVTAVFWDLARTMDHMDGKEKSFRLYLNKYVAFSMGKKHMILSAETLRKHLKNPKTKHIKDFEQAHNALRTRMGKCFLSGAVYGEEAPETRLLRRLRDEKLVCSKAGRAFIATYYTLTPPLAAYLAKHPRAAKLVAGVMNQTLIPTARQWITVPTRVGRK